MMIFDHNLTDEDKAALAKQLSGLNLSPEEIEDFLSKLHLVKQGNVYGHVHTSNVADVVERAIHKQNCQSVSLKVSRHGDEETYDGHLDIEVVEME